MKRTCAVCVGLLVVAALAAPAAHAKNVDLATVPPRASVQLTIYNSEDLTLVREARNLSLKKGSNHIQYSWANTLIDPTSVEIRPLENAAQIDVLDTTFPGDKPQHLIWNIDSKIEGEVKFQVTYFTSGLSWSADYVLVAKSDESAMSFDGYVTILNDSGDDYENAQVRLVVGTVNLVEKIRDLASRGLLVLRDDSKDELARARKAGVRGAVEEAEVLSLGFSGGVAAPEIIKEGLSEYFIYTIEGFQDVRNQSSKRLASFQARDVGFDILYRLRPHQYGPRPVRFFILKNDEEHKLGTTPLPDGVVRTFRDNGRDGLCFLGRQSVKYVPIKADIELNVGTDDEVVSEGKLMKVERSNFSFDRRRQVNGWDETRVFSEEVRNYLAKPVRIEIRRVVEGDVTMDAEGAKLYDYQTVEFNFTIKPGDKFAYEYRTRERFGVNAKQNRITLASNVM